MSDEIRSGRRSLPFAAVPHWLLLGGATPPAVHLYALLLSHVNESRGDGRAWPGLDILAELMGFRDRKPLQRYITELKALGALDVATETWARGRRNVYTVHETPPAGHEGPTSLAAFYEQRRAADFSRETSSAVISGPGQRGSGSTEPDGSGRPEPDGSGSSDPQNKTKKNQTKKNEGSGPSDRARTADADLARRPRRTRKTPEEWAAINASPDELADWITAEIGQPVATEDVAPLWRTMHPVGVTNTVRSWRGLARPGAPDPPGHPDDVVTIVSWTSSGPVARSTSSRAVAA